MQSFVLCKYFSVITRSCKFGSHAAIKRNTGLLPPSRDVHLLPAAKPNSPCSSHSHFWSISSCNEISLCLNSLRVSSMYCRTNLQKGRRVGNGVVFLLATVKQHLSRRRLADGSTWSLSPWHRSRHAPFETFQWPFISEALPRSRSFYVMPLLCITFGKCLWWSFFFRFRYQKQPFLEGAVWDVSLVLQT